MNTDKLRKDTELTEDELDTMFDYLFDLQESGATNMLGAGAWLEETFDLHRKTASQVLVYWMQNYEAIKENFAQRKTK